jgi:phosphate transport system protein
MYQKEEPTMARNILDRQLEATTKQVLQLGEQVGQMLEQALQAVQTGDQALCGLVIASDTFVDELRASIDRAVFDSLTLQQPLGGRDLRFLSSIPSVSSDLERTGDNASGIAKLILRMTPLREQAPGQAAAATDLPAGKKQDQVPSESSIIGGILDLGHEARGLLARTMNAFAASDCKAARTIWQEDDVVDVRYHMVRHDIMRMLSGIHAIPALQQDERVLQRITYWLWIAHNLERVGDHCTNICERIAFIIEGEASIKPEAEQ